MTTPALDALAGSLGVPIVGSRLIPEGQAYVPAGTRKVIHVGIPSRNATEARLIVREGMAATLTWLGEPIQPWPLKVAALHYAAQQDGP
jgi:hypothetical protein